MRILVSSQNKRCEPPYEQAAYIRGEADYDSILGFDNVSRDDARANARTYSGNRRRPPPEYESLGDIGCASVRL